MNQFVSVVLITYAVAWLLYMAGLRNKQIAFTLWFPMAATSFLGALTWIWFGLMIFDSTRAHDEGAGWMLMGEVIAFGCLFICPIVFALSIWQRPPRSACGLMQTVPIVVLYFGLLLLYRPISEGLENEQLQLVVMDTKMKPLALAKVKSQTYPNNSQGFSFPASSMSGRVETGADGTVILPVPKTQEINCTISLDGYATLNVRMGRLWGTGNIWHHSYIHWQFPPRQREFHEGDVQTDVDDAPLMHLSVYLPKTSTEAIPNYGPVWTYSDEHKWTMQPSKIRRF